MKENTFIACAAFVMVVLYLLVYRIHPHEYGEMARFVGDDALIYFEQHDKTDWLDRFTTSRFGKRLADIKFNKTCSKIGLSASFCKKTEHILSSLKKPEYKNFVKQILGEKIVVAVLPPLKSRSYEDPIEFIKLNSLLIAQPRQKITETQVNILATYPVLHGAKVISVQYGNHKIYRILAENMKLFMVSIDGFLIIGSNEYILRHSIDLYDAQTSTLAQSKIFMTMKESFKKPTRFFYIPVDHLRTFLTKTTEHLDFGYKKIFLKELKTTAGFKNFAYGAWQMKHQVNDKIVVQYDRSSINRLVAKHFATLPSKCSMFSLISEKPIMYYWSNSFNFHHFLPYIKGKDSFIAKSGFLAQLEVAAGMSLDDFFTLLGREVSFVMESGNVDEGLPIPTLVIFIKSSDILKIRSTFEKILLAHDTVMIKKRYGPLLYFYWAQSLHDGLQLIYGFWGNKLILSNSSKLLRKVADRSIAGKTLFDYPVMKKLNPGIQFDNNSITYTKNGEIFQIVRRSLNLIAAAVAVQDREKAFKLRTIIEEIITPFMDGAKMYDTSVTRSFFSDGQVVIETRTLVKDNHLP